MSSFILLSAVVISLCLGFMFGFYWAMREIDNLKNVWRAEFIKDAQDTFRTKQKPSWVN